MSSKCYPESSVGNQPIEGPSVETPIPLSNGLNVPTFGTLRGYARFYTQCEYIPQNHKPDLATFIQLSKTEEILNYFQETLVLSVESYPQPLLRFSADVVWEQIDYSHWRVYPNPDSKDFYVELAYTLDSESEVGFSSHFDITLVGYDTDDSVPFSIPVTVYAADKESQFTMTLGDPYIYLSAYDVWLTPSNLNTEYVNLKSNLHWRFVF